MRSIINLRKEDGKGQPSRSNLTVNPSRLYHSKSQRRLSDIDDDLSFANVRLNSLDLNIALAAFESKREDTSKEAFFTDLSPIVLSRRTEHADAATISKLIKNPQTWQLFGEANVHEIIEHSYYSLSQVNERGKVVAHIALFDYPNVYAVPSNDWLSWLKRLYRLERATVRNTLFVHFLVWNVRYSNEFLKLMLDTVFMNNTYLQHILIVVPAGAPVYDIFEEYFQRLLPTDYFEADPDTVKDINNMQTLLLCMRQPHMPRLKIRRASQEDNDDIVPMLDKLAPNLTTLYGEYYIAEMVAYPSDKRQIIVAEKEDHAIGIMSMTNDVDCELLNEQFELAPFYGLRKYDERDHMTMPETYRANSVEGINLPMVIQSDESLSKVSRVSQLSTLYEAITLGGSSLSLSDRGDEEEEVEEEEEEDDDDEDEEEEKEEAEGDKRGDDESDDVLIIQDDQSGSSMFLSRYDSETTISGTFSVNQLSGGRNSLGFELLSRPRNHSMSDIPPTPEISTILLGKTAKTQGLKIPVYYGAPNAFSIELFAMSDNEDERYAFDFLEAAFECFPEMDYCIIALPAMDPVFSLLNHFTRVTPRPNKSFHRELYVVHRNAIISELEVRNGLRLDQMQIQLLLNRIDKREAIQIDFQHSICYDDSDFRSFVMTSEETIVGLAIVSAEIDLDYLRSHYDIEAYTKMEHHKAGQNGILKHFVLSPIFHRHSRYFLKEIHRQSGLSSLYYSMYCRDPADLEKFMGRSLITCIGEMLPITPRRQIEYYPPMLGDNGPHENILRKEIPFALYHISRRFTSLPKMDINSRIVVIGASETALAFLEVLLFRPSNSYMTLNNVTLVSPHGLPGDIYPHPCRDMLLPYHGRYNSQHMARTNFRTYVNLAYGILTAINRTKKYVVINDDSVINYEYLLLFCGEQFQKPSKPLIKDTSELGMCHHHNTREAVEDYADEFPSNLFLINTELDAANALTALKRMKLHPLDFPIIIYGSCINAYCCIAALLEFGISGQNIVFVECFPTEPHAVSYFNDGEIDLAHMNAVNAEGVKWYNGYYFVEWTLDSLTNHITRVVFESKTKAMTLECMAMFSYGNKKISNRTFSALTHAALVYDGKLVIDANFNTSDPSIIAAGSMTKYKRCYYADKMNHGYYNSAEIGTMVGEMFMHKLDPSCPEIDEDEGNMKERRDSTKPSTTANMLTPLFIMPLVTSCKLAGGMHYLHIRRPGPVMPLEADMSREDYGQVLLTGNWKDINDPRHFRLHLNAFNIVETITCYTKQHIDVENMITLYGKHEKLLNNLVTRFDMGYIDNFYEYFREPWACAIFHDRFPHLQNVCRLDLLTALDMPGKPLVEVLLEEFNKNSWKKLSEAQRGLIEQKYNKLGYEKLVEKLLVHFIDYHHSHLTMYATPKVVHRLLKGAKISPLYSTE